MKSSQSEEIEFYVKDSLKKLLSQGSIKINLGDSFARLGTDSLLLAKFEYELSNHFQHLAIPPGFCFENQSPQKVINQLIILDSQSASYNITNLLVTPKNAISQIPLSRAQQRIWLESKLHQFSNSLVESFSLKLCPKTKISQLIHALNSAVINHSILRTAYSSTGSQQIIYSGTECYFSLAARAEENLDIDRPTLDAEAIPVRIRLAGTLFTACFHHILIDGRSIRLFMKAILVYYNSRKKLCSNKFPQYTQFCLQEIQLMNTRKYKDILENSLKYWTNKLAGWELCQRVSYNLLETDTKDLFAGGIAETVIDSEMSFQLYKLGQENGATIFTTLMTILRCLIYKMYGIKDLCLGIPIENRCLERVDYGQTIGLFLNLCVAKEVLEPQLSFKGVLKKVAEGMRQLMLHSHVPFDELVKELRKNSSSPCSAGLELFQMAVIQDTCPRDDFDGAMQGAEDAFKCELVKEIERKGAQYPILWHFIEQKASRKIKLRVEYNKRLFGSEIVAAMLQKFKLLCVKIANNFYCGSKDVKIRDFNLLGNDDQVFKDDMMEHPDKFTPIEIICAQLKNLPCQKIVVEHCGEQLCANDLLMQSQSLCYALNQNLFRINGQLNYVDQPIALLLQKNRSLIVCVLGVWMAGRAIIPISNDWPEAKVSETLSELPPDTVLLTDRKPYSISQFQIYLQDLIEESKACLNSTINNFASKPEDLLYLTATSGSTGKPKVVCTEGKGLVNLVCSFTRLFSYNTNSVVYQVVNYAFDIFFADVLCALMNGSRLVLARDSIPRLEELKQTSSAAVCWETISRDWLHKALQARISLVQLFGFTEHTVFTNYQWIRSTNDVLNRMNIGKALPNIHIYLVDDDGQPVPASAIGHEGNLRSSGAGLMRGYLYDMKSVVSLQADTYFESGDRARIMPGGHLEFRGRRDKQVKIRGNRVELLEIEQCLAACKDVDHCIAEWVDTKKQLIAFVSSSKQLNIQELREKLSAKCPPHMIPDNFVMLQDFPLNSNGKIDRNHLLKMFEEEEVKVSKNIITKPNTNEVISQICDIFAECLGIPELQTQDNLFERGADSLKLMMAVQRVEQELGILLQIREIFRKKSIANLIEGTSMAKKFPHLSNPNLQFNKCADTSRLHFALNRLIQVHSILRTVIVQEEGQSAHQLVYSATESFIYVQTEGDLFYKNGFSKQQIPVRAYWSSINQLRLQFQHIAVDGQSLRDIARHLKALYCGQQIAKPSTSYAEFAIAQRSMSYAKELEYWSSQLENVKNQQMPVEIARNQLNEAQNYSINTTISENRLKKFSQEHSCTIAQVITAALLLCFDEECSDTKDFVLGVPFSGRSPSTSQLIGYLVNVQAVHFTIGKELSKDVENLIKHVKEQMVQALDHSAVPFQLVVQKLKPRRKFNCNPLFQRMLVVEESEGEENILHLEKDGLTAKVEHISSAHSKFDQSWKVCIIHKREDLKVKINVEFNKHLFYLANIQKTAANFVKILEKLLNEEVESVESRVTKAWARVLGVEQIDLDDNFFDIGGHSLLASRICSLLKCDIAVIFQHQTIREMVQALSHDKKDCKIEIEPVKAQCLQISKSSVCYLQNQLLLIYKNATDPAQTNAYTISLLVALSPAICSKRLKECLWTLLSVQSNLRSVFEEVEANKFVQKVLPMSDPLVQSVISRDWGDSDRAHFEPFSKPPIRIRLSSSQLSIELSHLIFDSTSMNVLAQQLLHIYYQNGSIVPTLRDSYSHFSERFNKKCDLEKSANCTFWQNYLKKNDEENTLQTDKSSLTKHNWNCATWSKTYSGFNHTLGKLCKQHSTTPITLLLFTLARILQQRMNNFWQDFCIGLAKDMRDTEDLNQVVGFFVNTLPIPIQVRKKEEIGKLSVKKEIAKLHKLVHSILNQHSYTTYDQLLSWSGRDSLFDVMLVVDNANPTAPNDLFQVLDQQNLHTKFPIAIFISIFQGDVSVKVEFLDALFHIQTIEVMVEEWVKMVQRLGTTEPDAPSKLVEYPSHLDLIEVLYEQAQTLPLSTIAIQTPTRKITYNELVFAVETMADRLSLRYFAETGGLLGPDCLLGVLGGRSSVECVLVSLAVLRTGAAYMPVDVEYNPDSRVQNILKEGKVNYYIGAKDFMIDCAYQEDIQHYKTIIEQVCQNGLMKPLEYKFMSRNNPQDLAYVIFTSGTTGNPKGVTIPHEGVLNMLCDASQQLGVSSADCIYQFTNFCFDNSVLEIWLALSNGAKLFADEEENFSASKFCEQVDQYRITHAFLFPAVVDTFEEKQLTTLSHLKYWITGAEKLGRALLKRALDCGVNIIQNYGPTECTCYTLRKRMKMGDHPQNLGMPIRNMSVKVLTPTCESAIPLSTHELYVAGVDLPEVISTYQPLNSLLFSLMASGDLVQQQPNGEIQFMGRVDHQVKIRGFRVEVEEIKNVLLDLPTVRAVKVILNEENEHKYLIAYVVPVDIPTRPTAENLKKWCQKQLPHYMVPRFFIFLAEIPLTSNAKIDIKDLPRPITSSFISDNNYMQTDNQKKIYEVLATVLEEKHLDPEQGFIYSGGNSLNG
uniref:Carrier domain-containing protein n=1 Tax=Ditylenchus dipsaci TaxID=166011 RepID=A0A915DVY5_9BILA